MGHINNRVEGVLRTDSDDIQNAFESNRVQQLHDCLKIQKIALDHMSQGLCLYDSKQRLVLCNRQFRDMYQLSEDQVRPGTSLEQICRHRIDNGIFGEEHPEAYVKERTAPVYNSSDRTQKLSDGRTILIRRRVTQDGGWLTTHEDVTEQCQAEAKITYMATHDALTGLANRTLLMQRLRDMLPRVKRGEKVALLWLDLDHFKNVNDAFGHPIGDALLCEVSSRISAAIRETDSAARLSGDEFAVMQVQVQEPADCAALARRLISVISDPYLIEGNLIMIGVSIGIALASGVDCEPEQLMKSADLALYRAKSDGRGTYRYFAAEMDASMQARREIESELRAALVKEEFELYYQPIMNLKLMEPCGFEALLRWNHPKRGIVPPNDFIPVAEETGLIMPITEWVIRTACGQAQSWSRPLRVAVNVSAVHFRYGDPALSIKNSLEETGLEPSRLEVEITESLILDNSNSVLEKLLKIKGMGVKISMDDFGTGYSSLSYLADFPFDKIKIDRSFVKGLPSEKSSLAILRSIAGLGTSLGMSTTAEGVETKEQLNIAIEEGCTEVQGFYFSRPQPISLLVNALRECEEKCRRLSTSGKPVELDVA